MKERNVTIDIMKGIGIILMVVGHSGCPSFLRNFIYTFHMPLFFMISGYLITESKLNVIKKNKNFILAIFILEFICISTFLSTIHLRNI